MALRVNMNWNTMIYLYPQVSVGSEAAMFSTISADDSSNDGLVIVDDASPSFAQGM